MKIGILGGGQLGRMIALDGLPLGMGFTFLEPSPNPCAGSVGDVVRGAYDDPESWEAFVEGLDVVSYEFENVSVEAAAYLSRSAPVYPPAAALAMAQDRVVEKATFQELGIGTAPFAPIDRKEDLASALQEVGFPAVLKTRRMGYDGKGQAVVSSLQEAQEGLQRLAPTESSAVSLGLIAEGFVPFDREVSIIAVAGAGGERRFYPLAENHHREGILRVSYAPAPSSTGAHGDLDRRLQQQAEALARRVLDHLEYVGVIAIELFQVGEDLLANEVAPRVHNSGHWTQDGAVTSQFENHVRAIAGLPLGDAEALGPSVMINLIGEAPESSKILSVPGAHLHLYDKSPRPGRKIGHVNLTGSSWDEVLERAAQVARLLPEGNTLPGPAFRH